MLLRFSLSASPSGQLLYLIPLALLVKSAVRDYFSVSGSTQRQLRGVGTSILGPKAGTLNESDEMGVVLRLRGVRLSASPLPCGANK